MARSLPTDIAAAFENAPRPGDTSISVATYDDEGASGHFRRTRWQDLHLPDLENYTTALRFFTPEAFVYFLPAYLMAACDNPFSGLAYSVIDRLCPPKNDPDRPSHAAWWSRLSVTQRQAVVAFLRQMHEKGHFFPAGTIESLEPQLRGE